jgi:hypothetical protein
MGNPSHNHPVMNFCLPPGWKMHLLQIFLVLIVAYAVRAASCDPVSVTSDIDDPQEFFRLNPQP